MMLSVQGKSRVPSLALNHEAAPLAAHPSDSYDNVIHASEVRYASSERSAPQKLSNHPAATPENLR